MMALLGGVEIKAQQKEAEKRVGEKVAIGVIGIGNWGREIVATLAKIPEAEIAMICDTYPASVKRAATIAPNAKTTNDYRKVLENKDIKAVVIATPTHQHKEIVLAALQAGKHVYCEAPLAPTIDDAKAIAVAAKATPRVVFQSGLQMRSDPQRHFLLQFIRAGAAGKTLMARAQWHKKQSWRFASPNPDREREINWRLQGDKTLGLAGEIGIHQMDSVSWFLKGLPRSINGFGSLLHWEDGRETPDTIQAVLEYPGQVRLMYDCTLANSFDAEYEMYYGTDAAVMVRENKAWMFKEVDSPLLGWEVYARKDSFYKETGIALVANATKLVAQGANPVEDAPYTNTPLSYALTNFIANVNQIGDAVEDFIETYKPSPKALQDYLAKLVREPAAGYKEGFEATVIAIKASEAVSKGEKITIKKDLYDLA
jgi:predicted dehydrogenase